MEGNQHVQKQKAGGRIKEKTRNNSTITLLKPNNVFWKQQETKFFSNVRNNTGWNAYFTGIYQPPSSWPVCFGSGYRAPLGQQTLFLCPALHAAAQPQRFLRLRLHQPGLMRKTAAFLSCLPHTPSQQSPFRARNLPPPAVGNAGLRVSCNRHFNLSSLCANINVSRNLDKSLTVSNARNVPYFLFHYEKWFYLDFSEIQCDCSFN